MAVLDLPAPTGARRPPAPVVVETVVAVATVFGALGAVVVAAMRARELARSSAGWMVGVPVWPTGAMPDSAWDTPARQGFPSPVQPVGPHAVDLWLDRPDGLTAALAGVGVWVSWLVVAALLLTALPVARAVLRGHGLSFTTARQAAVAAGVVLVAWAVHATAPLLAARRALDAGYSGLPAEWFTPQARPVWWPLLVVALLLVLAGTLAAATRAVARAAER
ncbi:hypothetical protein LFM56_01170 [Cellulomonas iranensis]|uniref:hypothetical protein n=1 Tax=Cellulomonas iranensis TaxID=76862 RepID=UPI001CF5C92E|nr:hypothetical protein [Cellulomonas iranensis]UCN14970.1 hypothetical protein LFM56_01170 [Cellulomonas iranensis]